MKEKDYKIYYLLDPLTNNVVYVGSTTKILSHRLSCHIGEANYENKKGKNLSKKNKWVIKILQSQNRPSIHLIENCTELNWEEREIYWISYYRGKNINLLNNASGGRTSSGTTYSKRACLNISKRQKGIYPKGFKECDRSKIYTPEANKKRKESIQRSWDSGKRPLPKNCKSITRDVVKISLEGAILEEYDNWKTACLVNGISKYIMQDHLYGLKKNLKNFTFRYKFLKSA